MQFGMPTLIEHNNLIETAELCKELGLDFIELNMNFPCYQVEELENTQFLLEVANEYQIYYTIHLDENLNVSDVNKTVSRAYMDTVRKTIHIAKKLHVPLINMHMNPGIYFTLPDKKVYLFEQYEDFYLKNLKIFRDMCEKEIGNDSIFISIENTDGYRPFQKKGIELLLESKMFSLTWDIGHSHAAGNIDESFLMDHENRLKHFHIHDAIEKNNHLVLGSGDIDIENRLAIAKRNHCRCVIETKTIEALRKSVEGFLKVRNKIYKV